MGAAKKTPPPERRAGRENNQRDQRQRPASGKEGQGVAEILFRIPFEIGFAE